MKNVEAKRIIENMKASGTYLQCHSVVPLKAMATIIVALLSHWPGNMEANVVLPMVISGMLMLWSSGKSWRVGSWEWDRSGDRYNNKDCSITRNGEYPTAVL